MSLKSKKIVADNIPVYDVDIFTDETILDPHPHYKAMRDLGPLVYLSKHEVYAIPRYADVAKALLDNENLISGQGVAGFEWPKEFQVANSLASDEPLHRRFKDVIGAPLSPKALVEITNQIEEAADGLIVRLIEKGHFDGMSDFAQFLPVTIISTLVGLPEYGREKMLDWAAASFEVLGVANERAINSFSELGGMIEYVRTQCSPETVKPGSWASLIWEAVADGRLTPEEGGVLHIDILAPSLDTTIFATGHLLHQLGSNPEQWDLLKANPELIPSAIDEALRIEAPVRTFARVAKKDIDVDGYTLPEGARALVMYGSANRDERQWNNPDSYLIQREGLRGHLGFGKGKHVCAGQHLAKLEMRSLLKSIVRRVDRIEIGEPKFRINNTLRGLESLPARFVTS